MLDVFFAPEYLLISFSCFLLVIAYFLECDNLVPLLIICITSIYFGMRGDCLPDYSNYRRSYEEWKMVDYLNDQIDTAAVEPIYGLISEAFNTLGVPFYLFVTILLVLSMLLKYKSIKIRLGSVAAIAICFYMAKYFAFYELVTIRQGIASALGILAVAIYDKKKLIAFILIICAALMHVSMLLFLIIYARKITSIILLSPKYISIAALVFISLGLVSKSIEFANRLNLLPQSVIYYFYQSNDASEGSTITEPQSILKTLIMIVFFSLLLLRHKKIQYNSDFIDSCYLLTGFMVLLRSAFVELPIIAGRASASLGIAECIISAYVFAYSSFFYRLIVICYFIVQFFATILFADIYRNFCLAI